MNPLPANVVAAGAAPGPFDPSVAVFVAQSERPPGLEPVDYAALAPLQRGLLVIDGTVTQFLEAWQLEPIIVRVLAQAERRPAAGERWLGLPPGGLALARSVLLVGTRSGRCHAWAESLIAGSWLTDDVRRALAEDRGGLGRILIGAGAETRRECLWFGREPAAGAPPELRAVAAGGLLSRTYRVFAGGRPVMLITERFPL